MSAQGNDDCTAALYRMIRAGIAHENNVMVDKFVKDNVLRWTTACYRGFTKAADRVLANKFVPINVRDCFHLVLWHCRTRHAKPLDFLQQLFN